MHRTSITEAALIEAVLFSTVFKMPADEPMLQQILEALVLLGALICLIEYARYWETRIKKRVRRAGTHADN